ncbi:hypothetical protein Clacol_004089 [Clathrus columnatus]|uniref:Carboxylic ester hydrolase n=1 Tax=Clathrus columnatus TaxID=1419009 RepID=A0AAV5AD74_9AGAM|nr:hypothetical protein Clacol_004089 [Clathrus columnatus]
MFSLKSLLSVALTLSVGIAPVTAAITPTDPSGPVVNLSYSVYEGTTLANGQNQWLGVRYGAPPIGNNHFRKAQPPSKTSGLQSTKAFGPVCYGIGQNNGPSNPNMYGEDCLFMNIWGPSNFTRHSKLPVFFWLSGGVYIRDVDANFNGTALVEWTRNNMIFIGINYRVGPFGFLTSEKVRANGDLNVGLYDQRVALEWVQDNIAKFGGDPDRVVLVGDSAGTGSIAVHLIASNNRGRDLFAGVIGLSPFFPTQLFPSDLEWQFTEFAQSVGCGNATDQLSCLCQLPDTTLHEADVNMAYPGRIATALTLWTPTIDGQLIPDIPFKLLFKGKFHTIPSIWGMYTKTPWNVDNDDGSLFAANASTLSDVASFLQDNYPELSSNQTSRVLLQYQDIPPRPGFAPFYPAAAESYADITFRCPGFELSNRMSIAGMPTWNYRYNVPTQQGIAASTGVYHMAEIPLLFGLGNTPIPDPGTATYGIIPQLRGYFTNFIRFLDPNAVPVPGSISWPQWEVSSNPVCLVFQVNNMTTETIPFNSVQADRCHVWRPLQVQVLQQ